MTIESQTNKSIEDQEEITLAGLILKIQRGWYYLRSKWIIILLAGIIGAVLGVAYSYLKKTLYVATTTFVLEEEKGTGGLGNLMGLASIAGVDLGAAGGGIFQGDNILGLYKSRMMLEQTLLTKVGKGAKSRLLVDLYIDFNQLREKWAKKPELLDLRFSSINTQFGLEKGNPDRLRDSILGVIVKDINKNYLVVEKPDKKLSTIRVDMKSENEFFSKAFNDELVKNVNNFYIVTKTRKTMQNVKILQHKTDSVRSVMNGAIFRAVAVGDATPNLNPTKQIQRVAPAQRAQFSAETNKSILAEMVKNLEMTKMSLLKETPLVEIIDQPILPLETIKVGKLKGAVIGSFGLAFMVVLYLIINRVLKRSRLNQ